MMKLLFSFEGRIGRHNYLLGIVAQMAILAGLFFAFGTALISTFTVVGVPDLEAAGGQSALAVESLGIATIIFCVIVILVAFYMSAAVQVKRLHDLNLSGWFALISLSAGPVSAAAVAAGPEFVKLSGIVSLASLGIGLACLFFPGTRGPNNFGDHPMSIFDAPDRGGETWADRTQAHRQNLRAQQEASRDDGPGQSGDESAPRPRRAKRPPPPSGGGRGKGGFGKRGLA